ncbi:hypothetical protein NUACC26_042420 [Scytonema sp. NUACC26]
MCEGLQDPRLLPELYHSSQLAQRLFCLVLLLLLVVSRTHLSVTSLLAFIDNLQL